MRPRSRYQDDRLTEPEGVPTCCGSESEPAREEDVWLVAERCFHQALREATESLTEAGGGVRPTGRDGVTGLIDFASPGDES